MFSLIQMYAFALLLLLAHSVACQDEFFLSLTKVNNDATKEEQECSVGSKNNLKCLCGESLITAHDRYREKLSATCNVTESTSIFSFCSAALFDLGYDITMSYDTDTLDPTNSSNDTFSNSTLADRIFELNSSMMMFQEVLSRTIVGVLVETEGQRCSCLDSYKKWLCTTGLPFFTNSLNEVVRMKPCLSICYRVLQSCPYYRPSPFQAEMNETKVIYGGYPAFDCPKKNFNATYGNCSGDSCDCIRGDSILSHQANTLIITVSIFLFLLIIRTIT